MNRRRIFWTIALMIGTVAMMIPMLRKEPVADGKTISQWLEILGDAHSDQRGYAAVAIQKIGTNALPWVLREIRRGNSPAKLWFQEQAERQSLIKFKFEDVEKHRQHAEDAFEILGETAAPAIPALMQLMGKDETASEVRHALVHIGAPAVKPLIHALESSTPALRRNAVKTLDWYSPTPTSAIPALVVCLNDSEPSVRAAAASALAGQNVMADKIIPTLIKLLSDPGREVQSEAAQALFYYGDRAEAAVEPLLNLATNGQANMQWPAIHALGGIGRRTELVVPILLTILQTADTDLRWTVIESLGGFPDRAEEIVPFLLKEAVKERPYEISREAVMSLGKLRSKPEVVLPFLISRLKNPDPYARWDAVWALRDFGDSSEQTISALKLRLQDDVEFYHGGQKRMLRVSDAVQRVLQELQSKQLQQTGNFSPKN